MAVDERRRALVKKEAKQILDKFSKALSKVKSSDTNVERPEDRRKEGDESGCDFEFREIMFENAPKKNKDFIVAERKKW